MKFELIFAGLVLAAVAAVVLYFKSLPPIDPPAATTETEVGNVDCDFETLALDCNRAVHCACRGVVTR